jgi:hypothetical protein
MSADKKFERMQTREQLDAFFAKRQALADKRKEILAPVQDALNEVDSEIRSAEHFLKQSILSYCDPYNKMDVIDIYIKPKAQVISVDVRYSGNNQPDFFDISFDNLYGPTELEKEEAQRKADAEAEEKADAEKKVKQAEVLSKLTDEEKKTLGF